MQNTLTKKILDINDIRWINPNFETLKIIPKKTALHIQAIIFDINKKKLSVLTTNNNPQIIAQTFEKISAKGYSFEFYYTDESAFELALSWYEKLQKLEETKRLELEERKNVLWKDAVSMIKKIFSERNVYDEWAFIQELIRLSYQAGSSDLHFQSEDDGVHIRIRKDWVLSEVLFFSHMEFKKYLIKLKFMSWVKLNIDYMPQDGRFWFEVDISWNKKKIDVRVNFMPWLINENIVMRFLDASKWIISFTDIWFSDHTLNILQSNLKKKSWIILVTWPTGSWKTTTLYSMLNYLNDNSKKIITLEDPIEYQLAWIQQSQINDKKWYSYEDWLKAILRQDPDIIMVWEIRTLETAEIAISAALTWHLVLSTIHTNTAIEAISRLLNMWIKNYMLAPALNLIVWQRLLRKLHKCNSYKQAEMAETQEVESILKNIKNVNKHLKLNFDGKVPLSVWCEDCWLDWYAGRVAAIETFDIDDDIRNLIINWKSTLDIYAAARQWWFLTFKEDAYIKMLKWQTTLDEIRRVI